MKKCYLLLLSGITIIGCHESKKDATAQSTATVDSKIAPKHKSTIPNPADTTNAVHASAALNFANGYVKLIDHKYVSLEEIRDWVAASPYVTDKYKEKKISEINDLINDPEGIVDGDVIFDGQDYPDEGFELELFEEKTNHLVLRGKIWRDYLLHIKLAEKNGKWLLDDCCDF